MSAEKSRNALIARVSVFRLILGSNLIKLATLTSIISQIANPRLNNYVRIGEADNSGP